MKRQIGVIILVMLISGMMVCADAHADVGIDFEQKAYAETADDYLPEEKPQTPEPSPSAPAQNTAQKEDYIPMVSDIEVRGNYIVSDNTILNKIKTKKGIDLSREVINEDIKRLYGTGFFQDVQFDLLPEGKNFKVIIIVDEKAVVGSILIEGNKLFDAEAIRKEINVAEGQILDERILKEGVSAIQQKYFNKGYKFASVDSRVDVNKFTKEATVHITVNEGEKFKIKEIRFEGVEAFKMRFLKKRVRTKSRNLFFLRTGVFKEKKFKTDLERITYLYQKEGYLDVSVTPEFEYLHEENRMIITIRVDEGKQYMTGEVVIKGNMLFPESEIWGQLEMLPGETFSQMSLQQDIDRVRRYYFERGYINARVVPETNFNKATGRVDVILNVTEGDLYFIDKVKIRGNTKTKDIVIRRELRVHPGEQFNGEKLEYSKERLNNLGYFEEVTYETEPGSAPNKRDLVFRVKEKQTGELSFGAGVSSIDQFVGFAEISQRNFDLMKWPTFTGGGQHLSLSARVGSVTRDFDLNFVEPYIFNKPISFGLTVFNIERESNNLDFDTRRFGASATFGKSFTDEIRGSIGYTLENVKIKNISSDAASDVFASGKSNTLSRVKVGLVYDTRDSVFTPTNGWYLNSSGEVIGSFLGGSKDYYNLQFGATRFLSFKKDHVLELRGRVGLTQAFGSSDQVPVFDRFFAGGLGTVRGFGYRRVGPKGGGDPIGGETLVLGSAEYVFPIIENFKGAVFIDTGHVNKNAGSIETGEFAVSIGPGLRINTPLGPVTLYYGYPISNKDTENKNGRFEFNLSRGF